MSASKPIDPECISKSSHGFILLEVLVAMSMILGVWMASIATYQQLALSLVQQEAKRSQLRKELDAFEIQEIIRTNLHLSNQGLNHDTTRVSGRHRSLRTFTQSTAKDKR
jgi:Tfp pilus assembly protein PilV